VAEPLLEVKDLKVHFPTEDGIVKAVDGVSFTVDRRETLGVVGESGSGKSVTFLTVLGLITRKHARISGEIIFQGEDLLKLGDEDLRRIRGEKIAMIFQDPLTALNPVYRVGHQITEALRAHRDISKDDAWREAVDILRRVGIPRPEERARQYPHEFSGGMRQRAMIAMALVLNPDILIADEPTTALDVTVQAQILELIDALKEEFETAVVMITHDLGVVAEYADEVQVMYAGKIAESGTLDHVYYGPHHPYTWGLLQSISRLDEEVERLRPIKGSPPSLINVPPGCPFHPRCPYRFEPCDKEVPPLIEEESGHLVACHLPVPDKKRIYESEVAVRA
jgi:peptide/nickel transport system ATP-binding protein